MRNNFKRAFMLILLLMISCSTSQQMESRFRERILPSTIGGSSALDKFGIRYFDSLPDT